MRRIPVTVQDLYAAMCATYMDGAAWFRQAGKPNTATLCDKLVLWYMAKQQSLAAADREELLQEWKCRKGASAQVGKGMGQRLKLTVERKTAKVK